MSFKQRQINLLFSLGTQTLSLEGLRCQALIMNPGGSAAAAQLQLRVYGMTLAQMNQYSSAGQLVANVQSILVVVSAGNVGETMAQVFAGSLIRAYIDFSGSPEVSFVCAGTCGLYEKAQAVAANSYKDSQNAEDIIKALAAKIGFQFVNKNGAHAVVQNHYTSGSVIDQIQSVARAAALPVVFENQSVIIWPNDGVRDDVIVEVGPNNGLVGYPTYLPQAGFAIKSEFNPLMVNGRTIRLTSSIPKANGDWISYNTIHDLSTQTPDGPWFTTANVQQNGANQVPVN